MPVSLRLAPVLAALALLVATGGPLSGQNVQRDTLRADTVRSDTAAARISPRGAMLRSIVVPGWGQAAVGSWKRAAVFFTLRGTSAWMLFKTLGRLDEARTTEGRLVGLATDSLNALMAMDSIAAERLSDPLVFATAVDSFPGLADTRGLIGAREQQRQDWIAYAVFFTLLDGVDAYVNAHFRDFPVSIDTEPTPGGGARLRLTVPVSWGGARPARRPTPRPAEYPPGSRRR